MELMEKNPEKSGIKERLEAVNEPASNCGPKGRGFESL
jgi:hypothetical protein